jgi:hypothetical protein
LKIPVRAFAVLAVFPESRPLQWAASPFWSVYFLMVFGIAFASVATANRSKTEYRKWQIEHHDFALILSHTLNKETDDYSNRYQQPSKNALPR